MKEYTERMEREMVSDGLDPVTAIVIHMAADGIWMSGLFGMAHPCGQMRELVIDRLRVMSMGV
jgi:hypothetical protein